MSYILKSNIATQKKKYTKNMSRQFKEKEMQMAFNHLMKHLIHKNEMQITLIMRYHFIKLAKIRSVDSSALRINGVKDSCM